MRYAKILVPMVALILFVLSVVALSEVGLADIVHLKNGGRIEGKVTDLGGSLLVKHRYGTVEVQKSDVLRIEEKASLADLYDARRTKIDPKEPADLVALGLWCRENGWESRAREDFEAALLLDPEHAGAHEALGHILYEGVWRTEREVMELKGYVLVEGTWLPRREAEQLRADAEAEAAAKDLRKARRALERRLRRAFMKIAYGTAKEAEKAVDEVVTIARERGDERLENYARDAKAYYDRAWKAIKQELVTAEIRAQWSRLKRPIPTFQTSLGAGSTPVTLQLPELSIVKVGTTVVIPAGRGD